MDGKHFKIERRTADDVVVLEATGEFDLYAAPEMKRLFQEDLAQGHKNYVVDMTGVTYLDSTMLGTLIGALRQARQMGGGMVLVIPSDKIRRIFEITGLDRVFDIRGSLAEAMS